MKNKKIISIIFVLIVLGIIGYYFFTKEDKVTTLNLIEKQWIENNKNKIIDMSIINDIPILSYNGEGLILDFLNSLNDKTGLSFNKISYKLNDDIKSDYAFRIKDEITDKDILIYTDNYVIVSKNKSYTSISELDINIGLLNSDLANVSEYLYGAKATYSPYDNMDSLLEEFNKEESELDAIVLRKTIDLKTIINNNYNIAYNINDYKINFVLSLGEDEKLNSILTKYYNKWSEDSYITSYNKYLSKNYFAFRGINDSDTVKFRSKRYYYGFIEDAPFDTISGKDLVGINSQLLSNFSKLTNAEISYKKYKNINELINAFDKNDIDLFYGISADTKYKIDVYKTSPVYQNNLFILKHSTNEKLIDSIKSLSNVMVVENSKVAEYLEKNDVSIKTYASLSELIKNVNNDSIIIMDMNNYNYYSKNLDGFIITNQFNLDNYSFIIGDIEDNKLFSEIFNFYIGFTDTSKYINLGLKDLLIVNKAPLFLKSTAIILGVVLGILLITLAIIKIKPKTKKSSLSKEDKLKYIDNLTSLRNRDYLNDNIDSWDNSDIYPQTIIIADLNNIAYINDNYGHSEGDNVIKQASNILIMNQIENTEIIRTNGNEFLIYLVGYDEKQIVTYIKKLNKELKELKHNFGAAIGYSMINDAIKTIDDAINEATIDMRNNKEEQNK